MSDLDDLEGFSALFRVTHDPRHRRRGLHPNSLRGLAAGRAHSHVACVLHGAKASASRRPITLAPIKGAPSEPRK